MTAWCSDVKPPLGMAARVLVVLIPWSFIALLVTLYRWFLLPGVQAGHILAVLIGILALVALVSFILAAISVTVDVFKGNLR